MATQKQIDRLTVGEIREDLRKSLDANLVEFNKHILEGSSCGLAGASNVLNLHIKPIIDRLEQLKTLSGSPWLHEHAERLSK